MAAVLGIDLGGTYCHIVGRVGDEPPRPVLLRDAAQDDLPATVSLDPPLCGHMAEAAPSALRDLRRKLLDPVVICRAGRDWSGVEVLTDFFKQVLEQIPEDYGQEDTVVVATVPYAHGFRDRAAYLEAIRPLQAAGALGEVHLLNEAEAAVLAYVAPDDLHGDRWLVVDAGENTTRLSLLRPRHQGGRMSLDLLARHELPPVPEANGFGFRDEAKNWQADLRNALARMEGAGTRLLPVGGRARLPAFRDEFPATAVPPPGIGPANCVASGACRCAEWLTAARGERPEPGALPALSLRLDSGELYPVFEANRPVGTTACVPLVPNAGGGGELALWLYQGFGVTPEANDLLPGCPLVFDGPAEGTLMARFTRTDNRRLHVRVGDGEWPLVDEDVTLL
ncbi:MAG: hypothetical protein KKI08_16280 [Armatimonadetes bacterium]|nr:hypothetical protein [Armatimonadota bacterium]